MHADGGPGMSIVDDTRVIPQVQHQRLPRDHDLAEWLQRIAAGDQTAFAHLYDALAGDIRRLAAAKFTDVRAVDAVVAATFLEVWRMAPTPEPALARTWVANIASTLIAQRQNRPRPSVASGHPAAYWPAPWASMSSTSDESLCAVLASRLNRRNARAAARRQS